MVRDAPAALHEGLTSCRAFRPYPKEPAPLRGLSKDGPRARNASAFPRHIVPELCWIVRPGKTGGRREGRVQAAPMARQQIKKAGGSHHRLGRTSGLPCAMALRLMTYSPRRLGFLASVAHEKFKDHPARLTSASGGQDYTISPSALLPIVVGTSCGHRIPRSTSVTTRTPLARSAGRADNTSDFEKKSRQIYGNQNVLTSRPNQCPR